MAKKRKILGDGITAKEVTIYSGDDLEPALKQFFQGISRKWQQGGNAFEARILEVEKDAKDILAAAGRPEARIIIESDDPNAADPSFPKHETVVIPPNTDAPEKYAVNILRHIALIRGSIKNGDAARAARMAVDLGVMICEANMKWAWEDHALHGQADRKRRQEWGRRNEGRKRTQEHDAWRAEADRVRAEYPSIAGNVSEVARRVKKRLDLEERVDTIKRRIK